MKANLAGSLAALALGTALQSGQRGGPLLDIENGYDAKRITPEREASMPKPKFSRGGQRKLIRKAPRYKKAR